MTDLRKNPVVVAMAWILLSWTVVCGVIVQNLREELSRKSGEMDALSFANANIAEAYERLKTENERLKAENELLTEENRSLHKAPRASKDPLEKLLADLAQDGPLPMVRPD